jgi:hypothetical protein
VLEKAWAAIGNVMSAKQDGTATLADASGRS